MWEGKGQIKSCYRFPSAPKCIIWYIKGWFLSARHHHTYRTYLPFMCSEEGVQLLWTQVAIISQHVEVHVHRLLLSVCHAENVDTPCSDRQGFRQEVPEGLQLALPLDARVDKIPRCKAFGRRGERGLCVKHCCLFGDNYRVDQNLL